MNGSLAQKKAPQLALAAAILSAQICLPGLPGLAHQQCKSEPNIVECVQKQPDSEREIVTDIALIIAAAIAVLMAFMTRRTVFKLSLENKALQEKFDKGEEEKKEVIRKIQDILNTITAKNQ